MPPEIQAPIPESEQSIESKYERPIKVDIFQTADFKVSMSTVGKREPNEDAVLFDGNEQITAVFDGVGGAAKGEVASSLARDNLSEMYRAVKSYVLKISEPAKESLWRELLESNSHVLPSDLTATAEQLAEESRDFDIKERNERRRAKSNKIFNQDIETAKQLMDNLPQDVKNEALALYKTMQELFRNIKEQADKYPENNGMGSTVAGLKIVEAENGRRYGVFFGVGDCDGWIYRAATGKIERAIKTDNTLEAMLGGEMITEEKAQNLKDPIIRRLRFQGVTQALGFSKSNKPAPHIMAYELFPGDRFLLNSDGLSDNDTEEKFKKILAGEKLEEAVPKMIKNAFQGIDKSKVDRTAAKGEDDITVLAGEIRPPRLSQKWNLFIDQELSREGLTGIKAKNIKRKIDGLRDIIAQSALDIAKARGETKPEIITEILQEQVRAQIKSSNS